MATKKKIARTKRRTKQAAEKPTIAVRREELERWSALLGRAQAEAIAAAPRSIPLRGDGEAAAIRAYDTLRWVRIEIARLIEQTEGGAS